MIFTSTENSASLVTSVKLSNNVVYGSFCIIVAIYLKMAMFPVIVTNLFFINFIIIPLFCQEPNWSQLQEMHHVWFVLPRVKCNCGAV